MFMIQGQNYMTATQDSYISVVTCNFKLATSQLVYFFIGTIQPLHTIDISFESTQVAICSFVKGGKPI